MGNTILKADIENLLAKDGDIFTLIAPEEANALKRMIFANKTKWTKISALPDMVYKEFETKMRQDCIVSEIKLINPPAAGPHILYEERGSRMYIKISDSQSPRGILHYRKCLAVVGYFAGIKGKVIDPALNKGNYNFSDEDWIRISIAARYCLMPAKFIQKVLLMTQMYDESNNTARSKSFKESFIDNMVFQTKLPEWVVMSRLYEHAYNSEEIAAIFPKKSIEELIDFYKENEHYADVVA